MECLWSLHGGIFYFAGRHYAYQIKNLADFMTNVRLAVHNFLVGHSPDTSVRKLDCDDVGRFAYHSHRRKIFDRTVWNLGVKACIDSMSCRSVSAR